MLDNENIETIRKAIKKALRISNLSYQNYIFSCFTKWCEIHSVKQGIPLADMINNTNLQSWYETQWQYVVETSFFFDVKDHLVAKVVAPDRYKNLLDTYPKAIHGYFPGTLLKMIKPQKPQTNARSREKYKPKDRFD